MNIIICGAGMVGFSISKQLSSQGHSVTVVDQSSEDIKKINDTQDVKAIVGRATLPSVLENAGAKDADMIIAVTRNDETNMIVCQLASSLFNISKKIARIRSQEFLEGKWSKLYSKSNIPIDVIISPEREVAKSLYRKLEAPGALDNVPFVKDKVKLLEIHIEKGCPIANVPLKDLTKKFPEFKAYVFGAVRKDSFVFMKKNDVMKLGDKVYEHVGELVELGMIRRDRKGRSFELSVTEAFMEYFGINAENQNELKAYLEQALTG